MSGLGGLISGVGDLFAAGDYGKEASLYKNDIEFAKESTAIKQVEANRRIFESMGAARSNAGGGNLQLAGSVRADLREASVAAGQYKGQIALQGAIEEANFAASAAAAEAQQTSQEFGAAAGIASTIAGGADTASSGGSALDILSGG